MSVPMGGEWIASGGVSNVAIGGDAGFLDMSTTMVAAEVGPLAAVN